MRRSILTALLGVLLMVTPVLAAKPAEKPCRGHACATASPTPAPTASPSATPVPADRRVLVMLLNFSDDRREPFTVDRVAQTFEGTEPTVAGFYDLTSWGQSTLTADVYGVFQLDMPTTGCPQDEMSAAADAMAQAAGANLASYTNRAYIFPNTPACNFGGNGEMPGTRTWFNLDPSACDTDVRCKAFAMQTFIHELGHNLGLFHAGTYNCTSGGQPVTISDTCTTSALGDQFDVMGCCQEGLFSNFHRLAAGWIAPSKVTDVTTSQTITVTPAYDQASRVYRIPLAGGQYLYLENRAQTSAYDPQIDWTTKGGNLLIRRAPDYTVAPGQSQTGLLDANLANVTPTAKALGVGQSFSYGGLTVTNIAWSQAAGNIVEVVQ